MEVTPTGLPGPRVPRIVWEERHTAVDHAPIHVHKMAAGTAWEVQGRQRIVTRGHAMVSSCLFITENA